jgi:hypothetical protein
VKRAKESAENPFGMLVLEYTIAMIGMLFAAWLFLSHEPELVFPIAAIAVGTHYFAFKTAYGMKIFWALGGVVTFLGFATIYNYLPIGEILVGLVGVVEIVFGIALTVRALKTKS